MLVGVPSYRHTVALQRREAIRELIVDPGSNMRAPEERVTLRFVMADDQLDTDSDRSDIWLFPLPAARRAKKSYGLEKYLLCNRFLRRAVERNDTPGLVVLADDDTIFNASSLVMRMAPFASRRDLVFGNVEEWFMWDPVAMISTCFAYSSRRWEMAQQAAVNTSIASLARSKQECLMPQTVGPFPYAKGHFLGYSLSTVRRLVTLFDCCGDEPYALGARATRKIAHPFYNQLLGPSHPAHPANKVLTEDVYYMHLLFKALGSAPLTLVHLTLSEYVVEHGERALHPADIYHKLKRQERWEYVRRKRRALLSQPAHASSARCEPLSSKYRIRRRGQLVARVEHCCQQWEYCSLRPLSTTPR